MSLLNQENYIFYNQYVKLVYYINFLHVITNRMVTLNPSFQVFIIWLFSNFVGIVFLIYTK